MSGDCDIVLALLNHAASLFTVNHAGETPLDRATHSVRHHVESQQQQIHKRVPAVAPLFASRLMKQSRIPGGAVTFSTVVDCGIFFLYDGAVFAWNAASDTEVVIHDPRSTRPELAAAQSALRTYLTRKNHVERGGLDPDFDFAEEHGVRARVEQLEKGVQFVNAFALALSTNPKRNTEWIFCDDGTCVAVPWTSSGDVAMRAVRANSRRRSLVCGGHEAAAQSEPDLTVLKSCFAFATRDQQPLISVDADFGSIILQQSAATSSVIRIVLLDMAEKGGFDSALAEVARQQIPFGGSQVADVTVPGSSIASVQHLDHTSAVVSTDNGSFAVAFDTLHRGALPITVQLTATANVVHTLLRKTSRSQQLRDKAHLVEVGGGGVVISELSRKPLQSVLLYRIGPSPNGCILHGLVHPSRSEVIVLAQIGTRQEYAVVDVTSGAATLFCRLPRPSSLRFTDESAAAQSTLKFAMSRDGQLFLRYNVSMQVMTLYVADDVRNHQNVTGLPMILLPPPAALGNPASARPLVSQELGASRWCVTVTTVQEEKCVSEMLHVVSMRHAAESISATTASFATLLAAGQCAIDLLRSATRLDWPHHLCLSAVRLEYGVGDRNDPESCQYLFRGPPVNVCLHTSHQNPEPCKLAGVVSMRASLWKLLQPYAPILCRAKVVSSACGSTVAVVPLELEGRLL
uniref:Uncharacterized protein n=1 Tax=Neobodo designis TaxID=312471 RepID=A0A7S1LL50_NEODS